MRGKSRHNFHKRVEKSIFYRLHGNIFDNNATCMFSGLLETCAESIWKDV